MKWIPLYSVLTAFLAAGCLPGCNKAEGRGGEDKDPPVPVQSRAVVLENAEVVIRATGTVEARSDVTVVANFAAMVQWVQAERQFKPEAKTQFAQVADGYRSCTDFNGAIRLAAA